MTPREPDRYEAKAREFWDSVASEPYPVKKLAAALRAAESEALERAAQLCEARRQRVVRNQHDPSWTEHFAELQGEIRALKPDPAAAPAAETGKGFSNADVPFANLIAPAQGAEALLSKANAPNSLLSVVGAYPEQAVKFMEAQEALLRECDEALREWPGFSRRRALRVKLAARATPQTGEGR